MCTGCQAIAMLYIGGRCQTVITTLKITNATGAVATRRAIAATHGRRNAGRNIQPGVPAISSGGTQSVSTRCCTMCPPNR